MAFDVAQLTDYAWSDIAKAAKHAMLSAAVGGASLRMPDGRVIDRISIEDATSLYNLATQAVEDEEAADTGGGNVLGVFGERA